MKKRKSISILLILCMLVSTIILPIPTAFALDNSTIFNYNNIEERDNLITDAEERSRYIDYEAEIAAGHTQRIPTEETLSTIVYKNSDNSRTVYYFDENIKYVDSEGNIIEKDITLESVNGGGYRTKQNDILTLLPNRISSGVTVAYKDNAVKLIPIINDTVSGSFSMAADEIAHLNTSSNKVVYESVFGNYTDIAYIPTMRGFKEEIVLSQYKGINSWSFIAETNGMYAYCGNDGIYYFAECEKADTQFSLGQVFVYDSSCGIAGGSMSVEPVIAGQKYCVTITADNSFLTDNSTVYPVYVDPQITITTASDTSNIIDATVYSGKPTLNTGTWTLNHVGLYNSDYGIGRMVVKLPGLISSGYYNRKEIQIENITYYVCEATGTGGQEIELYALDGSNWTETGVTWNNYGSMMGKFASATPGANAYGAFDITTLVQLWTTGVRNKDYGFILKSANETDAAKCRAFISNTHATTSKRPKLSVTYSYNTSFLKSKVDVQERGSGSIYRTSCPAGVSISFSSSAPSVASVLNPTGVLSCGEMGTAVITATIRYSDGTVLTRDCTVNVYIPDCLYYIKNKNSDQYLTVLNGSDTDGQNVIQTRLGGNNASKLWKLEYMGDGLYRFVSQNGSKTRTLCIDTANSAGNTNNLNLMIQTDASQSNRRFKLIRNSDRSYRIATQCSNYNKVLTVQDASCAQNANVFQHQYYGTWNDEWIFEPYTYSVADAVAYARANWNGHVQAYPKFSGDCANFVSQCMLAGGVHYQDSWWIYKKMNGANLTPTSDEIDANWDLQAIGGILGAGASSPWISAKQFKNFWSNIVSYEDFKGSDILANPSLVYGKDYAPGDVVQILGTNIFGAPGDADHTMFITGKSNNTYYLTYHSNNNLDKSLTDIITNNQDKYFRFYRIR